MKRALVFIGGLLAAGIALAGCDGVVGGSGEPVIYVYGGSSPPKTGETLRAVSSGAGFTDNSDFIWEHVAARDDPQWYEIRVDSYFYGPEKDGTVSSENDEEFTIGEGLAGMYLRVKRKTKATDTVQAVWVYSGILGRIQAAEPPLP
ncbi:MAG: hypothetical protein LBD31_03095 [Treponema sp.]|jgi:hypothetical protein|nr:hypothetical protein [Treponema sp.]